MIKGIIFDMDGVILDSNEFHYIAWNSVFKKKFGITLDRDEFASRLGESASDFALHFINHHNLKCEKEVVLKEVYKHYVGASIPLKEGVKKNLLILKKEYRLALATGANRDYAEDMLRSNGVLDVFDYVVAGDEVKKAKPSPEIFLRAADHLSLSPKECIVIEDASMGLKAAKAAGMRCIMVFDEFTKSQDHRAADSKVLSFEEISDAINSLDP